MITATPSATRSRGSAPEEGYHYAINHAQALGYSAQAPTLNLASCALPAGFKPWKELLRRQQAAARGSLEACAKTLREITLACVMYADDKRFFPRLEARGIKPRPVGEDHLALQKLIRYGYLESPRLFACPASPKPSALPGTFLTPATLSYRYQTRLLNRSARSRTVLFVEEPCVHRDAQGKAHKGAHFAMVDGRVKFVTDPQAIQILERLVILGLRPRQLSNAEQSLLYRTCR